MAATQSAIAVIGIDIGKNSFHIVGLDGRGAIVLTRSFSDVGSMSLARVRERMLSLEISKVDDGLISPLGTPVRRAGEGRCAYG